MFLLARLGPILAALTWAYWPTLEFLFDKWSHDPQYSHGFLVPLFSAFLIWRAPGPWVAAAQPLPAAVLLGSLIGVRWLAGAMLFHQLDCAALWLSLVAGVLLVGGWPMLHKAFPALLFLIFAVPLPYELERNLGGPLRLIATQASTFLLQTLGQPAVAEGNTILLDLNKLEVADACSGLKMLVTFAAFAVGAVLIQRRTWMEKGLVLLGIVPIAIAANVLRVTATGVSFRYVTDKATTDFLHDLYGWLMMPVGLLLLLGQLRILNRLIIRDEPLA